MNCHSGTNHFSWFAEQVRVTPTHRQSSACVTLPLQPMGRLVGVRLPFFRGFEDLAAFVAGMSAYFRMWFAR